MSTILEAKSERSVLVEEQKLAGVGSRAVAAVIDASLALPTSFATSALTAYFYGIPMSNGSIQLWNGPFLFGLGLDTIVWLTYCFSFELWGATPGKAIIGIEVRDEKGGRCAPGQVLLRNLLRPIDAIGFYFIGFRAAISSPLHQRIGDRFGRTIVTNNRSPRRVSGVMWWVLMNVVSVAAAFFAWQLVPVA
jgi:uncharacterized RDD family membrane protein YckC